MADLDLRDEPDPPGPGRAGDDTADDEVDDDTAAHHAADEGGRDLVARWLDDLRRRLPLDVRLVAWVGVALVAAGATWWLLRPADTPLEEAIPRAAAATPAPGADAGGPGAPGGGGAATSEAAPSSSTPSELVVHAAGAVAEPGVYRLAPGGRVEDLVRAAGGLEPDADASRINLAAPLADGDRLYVPRRGEDEPPPVVAPDAALPGGSPGAAGGPDGEGPAALIDLNSATEAELEELPGVGPATAAAIVAHRTENGPFAAVDDLIDVRGIGEAKLAQIRPLVRV